VKERVCERARGLCVICAREAQRRERKSEGLLYQAEVAAAEAAHRKRRREALKAERAAAAPPVPERAQPALASKRTRGV
jgi:hypothetical protein